MNELDPSDPDHLAIARWFDTWGPLVSDVHFEAARPLFHADVIGFGTHMDTVSGQENLERDQWRSVWPTIEDFAFDTSVLRVLGSPDRLMAAGVTVWTSTGITESGAHFPRNGRVTATFSRNSTDDDWLCSHTHFSLNRGTPQKSHGSRVPFVDRQ